jgi:hypothetical protein
MEESKEESPDTKTLKRDLTREFLGIGAPAFIQVSLLYVVCPTVEFKWPMSSVD